MRKPAIRNTRVHGGESNRSKEGIDSPRARVQNGGRPSVVTGKRRRRAGGYRRSLLYGHLSIRFIFSVYLGDLEQGSSLVRPVVPSRRRFFHDAVVVYRRISDKRRENSERGRRKIGPDRNEHGDRLRRPCIATVETGNGGGGGGTQVRRMDRAGGALLRDGAEVVPAVVRGRGEEGRAGSMHSGTPATLFARSLPYDFYDCYRQRSSCAAHNNTRGHVVLQGSREIFSGREDDGQRKIYF